MLAAQDQALRMNAIKAMIDKTIDDSKCRLCKEKEETVDHLVSACCKIAQTNYKETQQSGLNVALEPVQKVQHFCGRQM